MRRTRPLPSYGAAPYPVDAFVFDAEALTDLDASAAAALVELIDEPNGQGVRFMFARSRVAFDATARRFGLDDVLPAASRFATVRAAVSAICGADIESSP